MSTTQTDWPPALTFPGQTATTPGPVDMSTMYLMHHAFRRDLTAFTEAAQRTPLGDRGTWALLERRWGLFATVLHHHHAGEDEGVWPFLRERVDDGGRATLEAMEAEHGEIAALLGACADGFAALAARADEDARAALAVRLVAARESLGRHLRHEETEAIPLIQHHITPEEWHELDEEHFKRPLGPAEIATIVPWALHGVPERLRDRVLARTRPFQLVWWVTRRAFARRERLAFRFVP
jgi:hypothetical protein